MKIAVIGLGFVGLALSSVLASKGITTIGIDSDRKKCSRIAKGMPTFFEPNLEKTLKKALKEKLIITNKLSSINNCDFIFVTVGTPQKKNGEIDLSFLKSVVSSVGKLISKNKKKTNHTYQKHSDSRNNEECCITNFREKFQEKGR